ncbi:hypothetical protein QF042_004452 [Pedobacter sp. W3I1]|uniref:hypothetical protein n=1 Tax=Pedobacter sp. W3I1 TaxID=3042291 RepID=UPI00278184C8|nr:hypothetical protein [Pedobacter sp. W3I1]MDQ0640887.1 hypothetical protein [Pedobacter sp. W3I1]
MKCHLILIVLLSLITSFSYGAIVTGCQATLGSNTIYYVRDGTILFNGVPQYRNDNFTNRYTLAEVYCYGGLGNGQGSCYIKGYSGPGDDFGTLVSFSTSPTDCSIDDYAPLALFALAGIGTFSLTRFRFKTT